MGYVLDPTEHEVDCTYEGATVPTVERTSVCKELLIKTAISDHQGSKQRKDRCRSSAGVGFSAWPVSDLESKQMKHDFDSARPVVLTADGQQKCLPDEKDMQDRFRFHMELMW